LAGKADAGNIRGREMCRLKSFADSFSCGIPPVAGILFGPPGFGACERNVLGGARAEKAAIFVDDQSASAAGADVDAQKMDRASACGTEIQKAGDQDCEFAEAARTTRVNERAMLPRILRMDFSVKRCGGWG